MLSKTVCGCGSVKRTCHGVVFDALFSWGEVLAELPLSVYVLWLSQDPGMTGTQQI